MPNSKVIKGDSKSKAKKTLSTRSATSVTETPTSPEETKDPGGLPGKDVPGMGTTLAANAPALVSSAGTVDLSAKIKELVRLAQEQGYLTYNDINDALPESVTSPEELDEIYIKLRNLEVEIVDAAEVDRIKQPEPEEPEEKSRLDILDDPVRMYLKQMGQVALLTREQEVEISKRIESAENEIKRIIYGLGFAGKEHIALAEKLVSDPPKERFDRVILDKKIPGRESHVRALRKLIKHARELDLAVDESYSQWQNGSPNGEDRKLESRFKKLDQKLQATYEKFFYKTKVVEEMVLVAENIHDKLQSCLLTLKELEDPTRAVAQLSLVESELRKIRALEEFVRMTHPEYLKAYQELKQFCAEAVQAKTEMVEANLRLVISI